MIRELFWSIARRILFLFDAEYAHRLTMFWIKRSEGAPARILTNTPADARSETVKVLGMDFRSRVGLAAGFDKDAEIVGVLPSLGFGFAEIGTVTPLPQPGNEQPRLFRDSSRQSLFNRMGFNGAGADEVSARLFHARKRLPAGFRIGVNLGKNKMTPNEQAAGDYAKAAAKFKELADYLVINVSSPNTPGLRSLQSAEALQPIVAAVQDVIQRWPKRPPLLLKLAPELAFKDDLSQFIRQLEGWGIDGWVLTNTLGGSYELSKSKTLDGGWSGACLTEPSRQFLTLARQATSKTIISVGGIMTIEEALERRRLGADLVQIYTGWIYNGPTFPSDLSLALSSN